ncbi:MAG TPA: SOS response-associated peptidase [Xanthobacteraceae bacterium]|nr:SOS response-associated peptidase [Xanthobacteraceae bacterium]
MCGRAKLPDDVSEIKLDLKIDFDEIGDYRPRWNAPPTANLPVVVSRNGRRTLTLMRWGLVPSWADDIKIGAATFNARAEGVDMRPAFRGAWRARRRCLVIADGYYEWRDSDKQPFAVALGNRGPMTFAGLWDLWQPPNGSALKSFAIITTQANELLKTLHDRMPVVLSPERWAAWLGEAAATDAELKAMLQPYPGLAMAFWPVDRRVGNVKNDSPDLFAPLPEPA